MRSPIKNKPRSPRRPAGVDPTMRWMLLVVGLIFAITVALIVWKKLVPKESTVSEFQVEAQVVPLWGGQEAQSAKVNTREPRVVATFVDVSLPMGGFLPEGIARGEFSGFRTLVEVIPEHLAATFGGAGVVARRYAVASQTESVEDFSWSRSAFMGSESRIDQAVQTATADLKTGKVAAVAIVTDLIGTGNLTGAMDVGRILGDWLSSPEVRAGALDYGLLGFRADYWGVKARRGGQECQALRAGLGCWLSERTGKWRPLSKKMAVPFYVLLLGNADGDLDALGKRLLKKAESFGLQGQWQWMTSSSRKSKAKLVCRLHAPQDVDKKQFALRMRADRSFSCVRGEKVAISCALDSDAAIELQGLKSNWPAVVHRSLAVDALSVELDCGTIRDAAPSEDLSWSIESRLLRDELEPWVEWSADTDERETDLGKTLGLENFLEASVLRPASHRVVADSVLRGRKP